MKFNIAIAGATGAVGHEFIKLLQLRKFPIKSLKLLASKNSVGKEIEFLGDKIIVEELTEDSFKNIDIAFFSAGGDRSKAFAPHAAKAGALVIDNSSAFRLDKNIPLVVPECNPEDAFKHEGIVANPNCSTIQMVVSLKPIQEKFGLKRVNVATYQAVSGTGAKALEELIEQAHSFAANKKIESSIYPSQIFMNLIPHVDVFTDNFYTKEEMKMVHETHKILHDDKLSISATCVRVPIARSHSEVIQVETHKPIDRDSALAAFKSGKGIKVIDEPKPNGYPMPLHIQETYETYVGRVRKDISLENGISYWCVADQLYKGAALNAIQIAEYLIEKNKI